jgi:hypothetical protein
LHGGEVFRGWVLGAEAGDLSDRRPWQAGRFLRR